MRNDLKERLRDEISVWFADGIIDAPTLKVLRERYESQRFGWIGVVNLPIGFFLAYSRRNGYLLIVTLLGLFHWIGSWNEMRGAPPMRSPCRTRR